ncbi:hypothetical protein EJ04DRAFT_580293 [Polyplosphaeria fusca]|uniref:Rhodopsin domain-containing protein n=1 Tax=Polyplosphaeria fusca TaxID=682080 RepID=A0A9P4UZ61_9PLEO|nr:hypothetical protein EJ04DRAFT_580293 [Polyplosphaeria fusca]
MDQPPPPQIPPEQLAALRNENLGPTVVVVVSVFSAIAFIFVCLRFYARLKVIRNVGLEDYFIAISLAHSLAMAAVQIEGVKWGTGRHTMFLSLNDIQIGLKYFYWSVLAYCNTLTFTKLSILVQYRRIFTVKYMRLPIYIVMGIIVATGTEVLFSAIFSCVPVDAFWNLSKRPTARCINTNAFVYTNSALNIVTDVMIASLPIRAIWQLQVVTRQKIALLLILCLGWFVCIISMIRLHSLVEMTNHPEDNSYHSAASVYWSAVEVNLGIVCASAPALKPLVVKVIPRFSSRDGSNKNSSKGVKESTDRKSFIELKEKSSSTTMSDDLERGDAHVTALPSVAPARSQSIHVKTDFEQHFEQLDGDVENGNPQALVPKFPKVMPPTATRS